MPWVERPRPCDALYLNDDDPPGISRSSGHRKAVQRVLDDRSFENVSRQQIREILVRNGSVEYAMAAADRYAEQSRLALAPFAESEFKRALLWVPDFVVAREK